jgi:hypothetical protein
MTRVVNLNKLSFNWQNNPQYVYIGRACYWSDGLFGNPIRVGVKCPVCGHLHNTGGSTLECFKLYFIDRIRNDYEFRQNVDSLRDKILVCFCKPNPCHGDVYVQYLENN